MTPFLYEAPTSTAEALAALAAPDARFIAGGTNIVDLMKEGVARPATLVDLNALPLAQIEPTSAGGLRIGALARNADTAYHPLVRRQFPLLSAALLAGASPQVRNMATNGGNLLQRTRCLYFYDIAVPCNKRRPGSGCAAIGGLTRQHAILGASTQCIATHPSDMCVALAALDATVHVQSTAGARAIPMAGFHRLPGERPDLDSVLAADELVTHIELPPADRLQAHSAYLKLRDRASYAFALVSVAAALDLDADGRIRDVRVALGGVAHKPWRLPQAEAQLVGLEPGDDVFRALAEAVLKDARGQGDNDFKIPMAHRAIVRALGQAARGTPAGLTDVAGRPDLEDTP
ncbi:MAG: xanthine dehydrogenase family protein subunit M [Comamonadaceae bacterium]|nr:MAG: xanthine dehydrogenase family protein subunit M [Comamonadaceae bacterium]